MIDIGLLVVLMDQANRTDPHDGPNALAMDPNVIARPLTDAFFSEETEEFISKKLEVNAIHDDIFAHEEQNNTASNKGIFFQIYVFAIGTQTAHSEQKAKESCP